MIALFSAVCFAATDGEMLLQARNAEFQQDVIEVAPGVYTAVGFGKPFIPSRHTIEPTNLVSCILR